MILSSNVCSFNTSILCKFPDLPEFSHYPYCDFNDTECLLQIQARVSSMRPPDNVVGFEQFGENKSNVGLECDCPASCREIVNLFR